MNKIIVFFCISIFIWGCNSTPSTLKNPNKREQNSVGSVYYDVIIKSTKVSDDWEQVAIEKLNHKRLVTDLFQQILDEKVRVEDFFEETEIPISDFKKRIASGEISTDKISKLQFHEQWDTSTVPLQKKVISIVFAEDAVDHLGKHIGYRPLFVCFYEKNK
ncbi:hypothetical protein K4L44_00450 [Halosquirtibacter laminarini]|uniref:Uncharacterized protein n=1 Tax=Halosquirtibacter laminarini TaxID=3374600 RepID=A0AC61NFJ2_9BACT|nr:hypothetical protein K4L44_00450 [Prolixibacteraceae bacterium]